MKLLKSAAPDNTNSASTVADTTRETIKRMPQSSSGAVKSTTAVEEKSITNTTAKPAANGISAETTATGKQPLIVPASSATADDAWSAEQQCQLENALKQTRATDAERWDKIAGMVSGKTKKQCIQRYKRLAELVRQAKTAATTTSSKT